MQVQILTLMIAANPKADRNRLKLALSTLTAEDPTLAAWTNVEISQAVIAGMGELQLEIAADRLRSEFGIDIKVGEPQVVYRVTVAHATDGEMKYAKQADGRGQYAHVKIHLLPGKPGAGYVFDNKTSSGAIPAKYIKPIDEGIQEALMRAAVPGHPLPDVRIELYDGSYHEVDSSATAFRVAGSIAFQDASTKAKPVLMEPVMRVEVNVPREYLGDVKGSLASRRGQIEALDDRGATQVVRARVPMSQMFGYATDLRERTLGRATFTLKFDRYEPVGGGPDADDDRHSSVGWPVMPKKPLNNSAIALPEPD